MDKKELFKKYWFVGVIAIALLAFVGMYAADAYKNRDIVVNNKQIDGKYVAYTVDGEPVYADDFYASLFETSGLSQTVVAYERAIFAQAYETTEEMMTLASNSAASILSRYSQEYVEQSLKSMGYTNGIDDLKQYYIDSQKQELLVKEYILAHQDEYLADKQGTNGRVIYHILVKCDTTAITDEEGNITGYEANPTDEQKEKLTQIQDALKAEDASFEYIAYSYSEDGSSSNGGYLGMVNEENRGNYDATFAATALSLAEGEISEPIVSAYGYHIIKNAGSTAEKILDDYYYLSELESSYPTMAVKAIMAKGEELGFEIVDEDLKAQIASQLESEEN
ncbi:MAG: peptidylprolyl isomerase [Erysipelotrichaceae bacterium]|nr:peptidylprolyl isomerase [Erysipelotrichaceae bacterium]